MNEKTAIILVNWNSYQDTSECLASLDKLNPPKPEIILVDNGSIDGSYIKLKNEHPEIKLVRIEKNSGFALGNNAGIRYALQQLGVDYLLFLNNDTVVEPGFLSTLLKAIGLRQDIGIVGPKIYFYNSRTLWFAGGGLKKNTGFTYHIGVGEEDIGQYDEEKSVDFITGCALLVKKAVIERIGVLDPDYYNSHEDSDFCLRAKKAGYKLVYVPKSVIYHKLARTMGGRRSSYYLYYRTRNHLLFKKKLHLKAPFFWPIFLSLVFKRIFGALMLGQPKGAWATIMGIYDYYKGNWGKGSGDKFR